MNIAKLKQIWHAKDLRNDILFVLGILLIYRILAHIPIPGVDVAGLKNYLAGNQILGLLNIFTGGGLSNFSLVMLGLGPYITSSIIFQLLTMVIPQIEELSKEGERGQQKINQWTRYATVPLAILQSYATIALISRTGQGAGAIVSSMTNFELITAIISVTAGTVFLMWLGELISEKKIGNGASILIFAGIVTALPQAVIQAWSDLSTNPGALTEYIMFLAIALISIAAIVFITEGERTIPISYARQVIGSRIYGGSKTHLPLRVNPAGMIPIIFAVSIIVFPSFIAQFFLGAQSPFLVKTAQFIIDLLNPNHIFYGVFYFLLVVGFTYFYTAIIFQPAKIAENLQKQGGFVPGVRPGTETAGYLGGIMNKLLLAGSLFLGAIALLPILMQGTFGVNLVISGASMLIVVGVVIETIKQIDSQLMMRTYENQ
ncbi:MAG: Protein translocase subunit SecY [Parcubacteria group bacterium GW2011_GWC2_44_17]|uniref:Protein translocase subunit SecY n=1 Tax=Candidatus Jacksonbacteria bacterium RIFCSPLOWO2_02_FULL_44_20 TaxID=1798460 RepID=A0A1G2A9Y8_9BACT|nr:MAG: Protein translocase subunit SecY [Parcubacteria group bacterium GW2011_GWC2_44_17]KKT49954.1 MAG: Protein translocase subunit SecY [Parcubacteria group bacterium GW2011_GWF2_44_17]OGY70459.1 MAG: preprotein translocase subunit SecY [Candidatus Jacksonbacteria bacterium RIFCSPHIGHO2_12_FULL_44_12]OGY71557.1 MAG: preprotein translocase subunit SecY [Candidatus Jacksonbacteria bacterium RIFCSPHIGHO2_02_FULL_44_25]OGY73674.1 MAG: preprotein translocase subunit SecY [Candidatus Jacksonbacter